MEEFRVIGFIISAIGALGVGWNSSSPWSVLFGVLIALGVIIVFI